MVGCSRVVGGGGLFLFGYLGSIDYIEQLLFVFVVNVLLGSVVGIGVVKAVFGYFLVMVRDIAQLFVVGLLVVCYVMGYDIMKEDLGGWYIYCCNGLVDNLVEIEEEVVVMIWWFLLYLFLSVYEVLLVLLFDLFDLFDRRDDELFMLVFCKWMTTFDVRWVIELMVDVGLFFEIGVQWGMD